MDPNVEQTIQESTRAMKEARELLAKFQVELRQLRSDALKRTEELIELRRDRAQFGEMAKRLDAIGDLAVTMMLHIQLQDNIPFKTFCEQAGITNHQYEMVISTLEKAQERYDERNAAYRKMVGKE